MTNLEAKWLEYHEANPQVYASFVEYARELRRHGIERVGMQTLVERFRWFSLTGAVRMTDGFRISNNHAAYYARLIMFHEPDLRGMFAVKELDEEPAWWPGLEELPGS